ncbi:hypothetical protein F4811DRAFT_572210 [Daldinia bambusicola]|nr:hypothetical protein F4811DRAFT_572210 [Daldinia bambusicola]
MDSELLNRICSSTQASGCLSEDIYSNLHSAIKQFIKRWSEGQRTITELLLSEAQETRSHITAESGNTRARLDTIDSRLVSESAQRNLEELRKRILSMLWFPEINQRENNIKEASDDITTECLHAWHPSVKIFRFYFYEMGRNALQKRLRGCLRTLLYQVLDGNPDILNWLPQDRPEIGRKASEHDWLQEELSDALSMCFRVMNSSFCLFLDGLDEIQHDERAEIIELVEHFHGILNMKVCVTSRPGRYFMRKLGKYPSFRAQDLIMSAIETHGDLWELLKQRIEMFPPDPNELYENMWIRQNHDLPILKREAAILFWCVLENYEETILVTLLATNETLRGTLQQLIANKGFWSFEDERHIHDEFRMWILA